QMHDRSIRAQSLLILPVRSGLARRLNGWWLRAQLLRLTSGRPDRWTLWTRFPSPELVDVLDSLIFSRVVYEPIDRYAAAEDLSRPERTRLLRGGGRVAPRS